MPGLTPQEIEGLFAPLASHEKLGLAVSGGPDSLALMLLAAQWATAPGRPALYVYSVDHGLRPEAAAEAAMVAREAEALGLHARVLRWEGDKPASGVQAAARSARYRLMADAMARDGVEILATAHHLADQAETVLMRLAHGSGIDGLRGMDALSFVEGCAITRPLLGVHPDVLRQIVSDAGLSAALDPSNRDEDYERVRWRLMLPALEALGLTIERLGTFARRMDEASRLIHADAEAAYPEIVTPLGGTEMELAAGLLGTLNPAVATNILGSVLGLVSGDRRPPPLGALELLARRLQRPEPMKPITLHGCVIASDGEVIRIRKEAPRRAALKMAAATQG
ncbi:MAG: tRNA lysidine(34) synthetase TilS [Hyphomicrobiales bacterium]|nr:MAG: tRNA lysidine(34) synthetase TilS [Hyphomicrobiales bacterium]